MCKACHVAPSEELRLLTQTVPFNPEDASQGKPGSENAFCSRSLPVTGLCFPCFQLASQLRLFDPQLKEKPEEESFVEPTWLAQLQRVDKQVQVGLWLSVVG